MNVAQQHACFVLAYTIDASGGRNWPTKCVVMALQIGCCASHLERLVTFNRSAQQHSLAFIVYFVSRQRKFRISNSIRAPLTHTHTHAICVWLQPLHLPFRHIMSLKWHRNVCGGFRFIFISALFSSADCAGLSATRSAFALLPFSR